jgi:hypothetical protein
LYIAKTAQAIKEVDATMECLDARLKVILRAVKVVGIPKTKKHQHRLPAILVLTDSFV